MTFEVLTTATCRWSIRNLAALEEKGVTFRLIDVAEGLRKTDWFLALTPFGKTPALRHEERVIVESRFINEYVEEVAPGRRLLPTDAARRAWARIWNAYCDEVIMRQVQVLAREEPVAQQQALENLGEALTRLETHLFQLATPGRFWGGAELSLTDLCYWSFFDVLERVDSMEPVRRLLESRPRIAAWRRDLLDHPAFARAEAQLQTLDAKHTPSPSDEGG